MIICPTCDRHNENHYKFCLGCGTELSKVEASEPAAPKPKLAPTALPGMRPFGGGGSPFGAKATPQPESSAPVEAPPVVEPPAPEPTPAPTPVESAPPTAQSVPTAQPSPVTPSPVATPSPAPTPAPTGDAAPVSSAMSTEPDPPATPMPARVVRVTDSGVMTSAAATQTQKELDVLDPPPRAAQVSAPPVAVRRSAPPAALDDGVPDASLSGMPPPPTVSPAVAGRDARTCSNCGSMVPEGFKFCGVCGSRYEMASAPVATPPPPEAEHRARLILIHPDGTEGEVFPLDTGETTVGRNHALPLFRNDPFLSPRHATFFFVRGQLFVRDEASLNGIFLRIKAEVELFHRDMFRIGQQLLRFEEMSQVRPVVPGAGDGTTVMGSPVRGAWGRLALVVGIDAVASVWVLRRPEEQMGRERGELLFPEDGFISGAHCKLVTRDGRFFLRDIGSTNGSYLRIKGEGILAQGDLILLGQQLFKVDLLG